MDVESDAEYHSILEPHVIISDEEDTDDEDADPLRIDESMIGPEVSLIPIRKTKLKPTISVKSREKLIDVNVLQKPGPVQIITPEIGLTEEEHTQYARRRSQPLEKCPICKQFFRRLKTHLQKHTEITPEEEAILICQYCKKKFNTGSNLSVHMRTHTGDRPYICTVCNKGFAQSCNLVNHMRIHTGERPYKCPYCDKAFTQSGNLSNHVRLHTDEKPFKCHFCDKAFTQSGNLNSHIKNNHKYMTEIDGKIVFTNKA